MKKFLCIVFVDEDSIFFHKDVGMIPYSLGRFFGYKSSIAWFEGEKSKKAKESDIFKEFCNLIIIDKYDKSRDNNIDNAKRFIKQNIQNYDIVMFYNYGSTNYKLAYYCKKYNPNIKVYCKLDMNENGFNHFYENGLIRKIKNCFERLKSKYVDLFTVETKEFYEKLKNNKMFNGRLYYLPNGVSILDVNVDELDKLQKENIIVTVGRLGVYEKNNEMLLNALKDIDINILKNWKIVFIGPMTDRFKTYYEDFLTKYKYCRESIVYAGNITDRNELYKYYAKAKIICMTSRSESFGIAAIEGMYFGTYPILTNYGSVVNDITNYKQFGTIISSNDVESLRNSLEFYMNEFRLSEYEKAESCKYFVRNNFDYNSISSKLNDIFNNL